MLTIDSANHITLTRGDTAYLTVSITRETEGVEALYEIGPEDRLTITLRRGPYAPTPAMEQSVQGIDHFHIRPEDTRGLSYGDYHYDVQLTTAEGDIFTVVAGTFTLCWEVTMP